MQKTHSYFSVPLRLVGPIKINFQESDFAVEVPLATFETPLWPSVARGARVTRLAGGINTVILNDCMTRSILLEAASAKIAAKIVAKLNSQRTVFEEQVATTSHFAKLQSWSVQVVGSLIFIRFAFATGDAAGHNMTTKAAEVLQNWLLTQYPELSYVSISGNYCTDKKVSAVNGILGRGKYVIADVLLPRQLCLQKLRASPEQIANINVKKNLIGSIVAGGVRSANAHFANMLLGFYLATGQDVANIVEGSQGITYAEVRPEGLYFSVTLPNIIVGVAGNAKNLDLVQAHLQQLGCLEKRPYGQNAQRLAVIAAATVLCGELSLLAAQVNRGELMRCHLALERA